MRITSALHCDQIRHTQRQETADTHALVHFHHNNTTTSAIHKQQQFSWVSRIECNANHNTQREREISRHMISPHLPF